MTRCPETKSGRLPPEELSACEFCAGTAPCLDYRAPLPPELEPPPLVSCPCGAEWSPDLHDGCPHECGSAIRDGDACGCDEGGLCERHRVEGHRCGEAGIYCDSEAHALRDEESETP